MKSATLNKNFCWIFLFLFPIFSMSGQINDEVMSNTLPKELLPSPEASNLGRYGSIPVGHFSGTPSIQIPLYDLKVKDFSLPITLSYHASGIKVDDMASWVGLGWVLNAGGCITRVIKDRPDDELPRNVPVVGKYFDYNNYTDQDYLFEYGHADVYSRTKDSQCDDFFYNFLGHSGKFNLRLGNSFEDIGDTYINGDAEGMEVKKFRDGFEIRLSNGCKYYFTEVEFTSFRQQPYGTGGFGSDPYRGYVPTTWYLTKIETPFNEEITFSYKKGGYLEILSYLMGESEAKLYQYSYPTYHLTTQHSYINTVSKTEIENQLFLSQITFPGGRIAIESVKDRKDNPNGYRINSLKVYNNSEIIKTIAFDQSYFVASHGESFLSQKNDNIKDECKYRLKLNSVIVNDQKYSFDYNKEPLPYRGSFSIDWLGYYNNSINKNGLLPYASMKIPVTVPGELVNTPGLDTIIYYNISLGQNGVNRSTDPVKTKAGVLTKITYPTGGYTLFTFENHKIKADDSKFINLVNLSQSTIS